MPPTEHGKTVILYAEYFGLTGICSSVYVICVNPLIIASVIVLLTGNAVDVWSQTVSPSLARPTESTAATPSVANSSIRPQPDSQVSSRESLEDAELASSENPIDLNTLLMRRMIDYGFYYICTVDRKLNPSDFGFSNTYRDRIYQITVIDFTNSEYWLRDTAGQLVPSKNDFDISDVAIPQINALRCMFPRTEKATAAFEDAAKKYKPYFDLGNLHSSVNKTGILVTAGSKFESSGKGALLLKLGDAKKVETSDGFTKVVPVYIEQDMNPQKENAIVELWKRADKAEQKGYDKK